MNASPPSDIAYKVDNRHISEEVLLCDLKIVVLVSDRPSYPGQEFASRVSNA